MCWSPIDLFHIQLQCARRKGPEQGWGGHFHITFLVFFFHPFHDLAPLQWLWAGLHSVCLGFYKLNKLKYCGGGTAICEPESKLSQQGDVYTVVCVLSSQSHWQLAEALQLTRHEFNTQKWSMHVQLSEDKEKPWHCHVDQLHVRQQLRQKKTTANKTTWVQNVHVGCKVICLGTWHCFLKYMYIVLQRPPEPLMYNVCEYNCLQVQL